MDRSWLPVVKSWKLNERHYGALQGLNKAETAAKYEYLNLATGETGEGLSADEIRSICQTFNIRQSIF